MYFDVYVMLLKRDEQLILAMAREFIPHFNEGQDLGEYALESESTTHYYNTAGDFVRAGCANMQYSGGLRLQGASDSNPQGGWIYFNDDSSVVFGLTATEQTAESFLALLKQRARTDLGYIAGDCPPADSLPEFRKLCAC